jgi:hypothetical protein
MVYGMIPGKYNIKKRREKKKRLLGFGQRRKKNSGLRVSLHRCNN